MWHVPSKRFAGSAVTAHSGEKAFASGGRREGGVVGQAGPRGEGEGGVAWTCVPGTQVLMP